jgi:hypothetical protein
MATATNDSANAYNVTTSQAPVGGTTFTDSSNIYFVLSEMDVSAQMDVSGALETVDISFGAEAQATITVDAATMASVFQFRTDSSSIDDVSATDIVFRNSDSSWNKVADGTNALIITNATVQRSKYPVYTNQDSVNHDFIRHMAAELFNTHFGVDLFSNEAALHADLCGNVSSDLNTNIASLIGTYGSADISNADVSYNFGRQLMLQLSRSAVGRERLQNITASADFQDMPLEAGDEVQMKITIHPAIGLKDLTGVDSVAPRSYLIRLVLA